MNAELKSRAAREARDAKYGDAGYWAELDASAIRHAAYYRARGDEATAAEMLSRSLAEALAGNNGD